ncbi:MAG: hypothetical protein FWG68_11275 [Defluviitaleaceae bacterium]|nr:hypothetical protein [Defluviitaleaceae bacterium]
MITETKLNNGVTPAEPPNQNQNNQSKQNQQEQAKTQANEQNNEQNNEKEQESLNIIGDMAEKIKNNVKQQPTRFSWKLKFPKDIEVATIPETAVMLLNRNLKRLRCEFTNISAENAILISPHSPYKTNREYFFWAKYNTKEICVAFVLSENNTMQTFDRKTSMEKLNVRHQKVAEKLATEQPAAQPAAQPTEQPEKAKK